MSPASANASRVMRPPQLARRRSRRRWPALVVSFLLVLGLTFFLFTSSAPSLPPQPAPTADQVGAGRDAYRQLKQAKGKAEGSWIMLGQPQLTGLAALASHGLRPDRLRLTTSGSTLHIQGSHALPVGRWLNVTAEVTGPSEGFPPTRLTVGVVTLPAFASRPLLEITRWLYVRLRHADVPPIGRIARNFSVRDGRVTALLSVGRKSGVVDEMAGIVAQPIDREAVVRIYCSLADRQKREPSSDLAEQVHRAFSVTGTGARSPTDNGATFIALGILLVDNRVADFARLTPAAFRGCAIAPLFTKVYGRGDWPKHWALSAALSVGAGTQLSEAVGEWKELADSLAKQSQFAVGDPSGFSMADLSADRAGFEIARAATQPDSAARVGAALATASPEQLLPHALVQGEDGLSNAEFVKRYGGIDDPRFKARVAEIDAALARTGLR